MRATRFEKAECSATLALNRDLAPCWGSFGTELVFAEWMLGGGATPGNELEWGSNPWDRVGVGEQPLGLSWSGGATPDGNSSRLETVPAHCDVVIAHALFTDRNGMRSQVFVSRCVQLSLGRVEH